MYSSKDLHISNCKDLLPHLAVAGQCLYLMLWNQAELEAYTASQCNALVFCFLYNPKNYLHGHVKQPSLTCRIIAQLKRAREPCRLNKLAGGGGGGGGRGGSMKSLPHMAHSLQTLLMTSLWCHVCSVIGG